MTAEEDTALRREGRPSSGFSYPLGTASIGTLIIFPGPPTAHADSVRGVSMAQNRGSP